MLKQSLYSALIVASSVTGAWGEQRQLEAWFEAGTASEQRAICGAALIKFGMAVSLSKDAEARKGSFQLLYRGYALNNLAEVETPEISKEAWHTKPSMGMKSDAFYSLIQNCVKLYNAAYSDGIISESQQGSAIEKAQNVLESG